MNYLIRATSKRQWYVDDFLIPEMKKQGISEREIKVFNDNTGNLNSFINMCYFIVENYNWDDFVWVLQDDVMISDNFHYITDRYCFQEANGFCSSVNSIKDVGYVLPEKSWLSFQCKNFRVDKIRYFIDWFEVNSQYNELVKSLVNTGIHDDLIYHYFELEIVSGVHNLSPNIVEHVDYLIGGSIINKTREFYIKSQNFEDKEKIKNLKLLIDKHYSNMI